MSRRTVQWTETAAGDLENIVSYIADDNVDQALTALKKIRKRASTIAEMPDRGRTVPELSLHGISTYRELIVSPWRIIYRQNYNVVYVHAVIDSRRNLEDILLDRLIRQKTDIL